MTDNKSGRRKIFKEGEAVQISIYLLEEEKKYVNTNANNASAFFRQAVKAHKEGKWKYEVN